MRPKNIFTLLLVAFTLFGFRGFTQNKSFILSTKGDTLNVVDKNNLKQGRWVISVAELRGEAGYEEEGFYKDDKKNGPWRKYNATGDILAVENYRIGGKEGVQEYFTYLGDLERHEEWKGYNPDAPYDTIAVYGEGNNVVNKYKLVKAEQYSIPNGEWRYYAVGGKLIKLETYDHGRLLKNNEPAKVVVAATDDKPKEVGKTKEILDYEKKYSNKKRKKLERDGKTGL